MQDLTVIGGGVIGMMIAREMALDGASVELLERAEPGQEASWAGGGILSPLHPWRYPQPLLKLAARSQQLFKTTADQIHQRTGIDPEWRQCGLLITDTDEKQQAIAWGKQWQMTLQTLQHDQLMACEPALNPSVTEALYLPDIAQARNPRLLAGLRAELKMLGVNIHSQTEVTGFIHSDSKISALKTNQGNHPVNHAILCAGAWGGDLLATTGIRLPLEPVRGQMMIIKTPANTISRVILSGSRYLIPRMDGRVLVGSTLERTGFDKQTTEIARKDLYASAIEMAPCLADWPIEHHWAGLRPGSPSGIPYIGPHPELSNLHVALGHFRNGLMLAPATAELMKSQLTNQPISIDSNDYNHVNFSVGHNSHLSENQGSI